LTSALQYDRARRKVSDVALATNNMDYTYKQWSPRLGVVHDIAVAQQVFASISRNFEAPIFGLAGTSTTVNSAQSGTTFEAGARGQSQEDKNQTTWDITFTARI